MSDDSSGPHRARRADDGAGDAERPVTAANRRRRAEPTGERPALAGARTAGKGTATPTRDGTAPGATPVARLRLFLREVVAELRKVHWPTRRQIVVYTAVVLVFVTFMVSLVALLDFVFAKAVFALFG